MLPFHRIRIGSRTAEAGPASGPRRGPRDRERREARLLVLASLEDGLLVHRIAEVPRALRRSARYTASPGSIDERASGSHRRRGGRGRRSEPEGRRCGSSRRPTPRGSRRDRPRRTAAPQSRRSSGPNRASGLVHPAAPTSTRPADDATSPAPSTGSSLLMPAATTSVRLERPLRSGGSAGRAGRITRCRRPWRQRRLQDAVAHVLVPDRDRQRERGACPFPERRPELVTSSPDGIRRSTGSAATCPQKRTSVDRHHPTPLRRRTVAPART